METKTANDYYIEYSEKQNLLTDTELISVFNDNVGISSFGVSRQGLLSSIKEQLIERKIDFSLIGNAKSISYSSCVILKGKKLFKIQDLKKTEVNNLLLNYFKNNEPEKLKFKPKVTSFDNQNIKFGLFKHQGLLNLSVKKMLTNTSLKTEKKKNASKFDFFKVLTHLFMLSAFSGLIFGGFYFITSSINENDYVSIFIGSLMIVLGLFFVSNFYFSKKECLSTFFGYSFTFILIGFWLIIFLSLVFTLFYLPLFNKSDLSIDLELLVLKDVLVRVLILVFNVIMLYRSYKYLMKYLTGHTTNANNQ